MNPPPPMFPAAGSTTASANAVATAASTALPPFCIISRPAREPSSSSVATMPCAARTACFGQDFSVSRRSWYSAAFCASVEVVSGKMTASREPHTRRRRVYFMVEQKRVRDRKGRVKTRYGMLPATALGHLVPGWKDLRIAKELHLHRTGQQSRLCAAFNQLGHRGFAFFAVSESPFIYVHSHELVRQLAFHVARKLHCILQRVVAVFKAIFHAVANRFRDEPPHFGPQRPLHRVSPERQRQSRRLLPPHSQVQYLVQSHLRKQ